AVLFLTGLHGRVNLVNLVFTDQVAHGGIGHQNFHAHGASLVIGAGQQALTHDAFEDQRKLGANLRLLVRGEHVNDAVDGRGCRVGVQSAEGEVAGFGDTQRRLDGFQVAHFADQHHVRVFTKSGAQGIGKTLGVRMHFALIDQAVLVHVHELDRVLDGEDVFVALGIDLVDHGRQRGGFARARRPRYQHQPTRLVAHLAYDWRQTQLVERFDLKRNQTENASRSTALVENVGAEASEALQPEREI